MLQSLCISSPRHLVALGQTGAPLEGDYLYLHFKWRVKWHLMIPYDQAFAEDISVCLAGCHLQSSFKQFRSFRSNPQPPDVTVPLKNWSNEHIGDIALPGSIFNVPIRPDILHRVVRWQLAKRRQVQSSST